MLRIVSKAALALGLFATSAVAQQWYEKYDFSLAISQVVSHKDEAAVTRGKAILMSSQNKDFMAYYDAGSMNLRYVTDKRIKFHGTPWDGRHGGNSEVDGNVIFSSSPSLAWAYKGNWQDPRENDYAPLAKNHAHFKGSYRFDDKVILSYSVGEQKTLVHEMPEMLNADTLLRHFTIPANKEEMWLKVIDDKAAKLNETLFLKSSKFEIQNNGKGLYFIHIPAGQKQLSFSVSLSKKAINESSTVINLQNFTKGSKARWPKTVTVQGKVNDYESDIFAVDQIPVPENNPYQSNIRFSGFDYFKDGKRAAFCTWNGDVWVVSNLNKDLKDLVWKRYAAGMNETLGLRIVDDIIYVNGKDQITRLHDLNNDGEADFYENFNNDCKITKNFHEFTFDLQTDAAGNFYFAKASPVLQGGRGFDATHENHGVVYKVSKDGQQSEIFASGLRAPGGMSINAEGTIATTGENEGTYVPACKINYLEKGEFAGVIHPGNGKKESEGYKKPLCFIPMSHDNSGGGQVWVPKDSWGDLGGNLIHLSYGRSKAYTVFQEKVNGQSQGGIVELPIRLMSSGMRMRFNPKHHDNAIISGFKGWQTNASRGTALNRVRYKGNKMIRPLEVKATTQGLYLSFNEMLDPETLKNVNNFSVQRWNYVYANQYGSAHFATDTSQADLDKAKKTESKHHGRIGFPRNQDGEQVYVTAVKLLRDGKTVFLKLNDMKPVDNMKVVYQLKTAKGKELHSEIINTIYNLSADDSQVPDMVSVAELELKDKIKNYPTGVTVEIKGTQAWEYDNKIARLLNIQLQKGELASPFLKAGPFSADYHGHLIVTEKAQLFFQTVLKGSLRFEIDGKLVLEGNENGALVKSKLIKLDPGAHSFKLSFKSDTAKESFFNLKWKRTNFPLEPISPNSIRYGASATSAEFKRHREGRNLIVESRCISCHKSSDKNLMPELLSMDSPSLDNVGGRLHKAWMAEWIANPKRFNKHSHMPSLVNKKEAQDIAEYLATKVDNDLSPKLNGNSEKGSQLFYDLGCISCHTRPEERTQKGDRLLLNNLANKYKPQALKQLLMSPEKLYKWTKMPNFKLSDQEATDIATFLLDRAKGDRFKAVQADSNIGHKLFKQKGCIDCHGGDEKSLLQTVEFEKITGDLKGCLGRKSKIKLGINGHDLNTIRGVFKYKKHSLQASNTSEFAERQIELLNCNACHTRDDSPSKWGSYIHEVKDLKTHYKDKGHLDQSRPQLTYVGEKIKEGTLKKYLDGSLEYNSREWLLARMPSFPARAELLTKGLAQQHANHKKTNSLSHDKDKIAIGKKLVGTGGFGCIVCHDTGNEKAIAAFEVKGVNLKYTADRLGKDFYMRWMLNPAHIVPNTKMPKYADDKGKSPLPDYKNDAAQQFDAIFEYINTLK